MAGLHIHEIRSKLGNTAITLRGIGSLPYAAYTDSARFCHV